MRLLFFAGLDLVFILLRFADRPQNRSGDYRVSVLPDLFRLPTAFQAEHLSAVCNDLSLEFHQKPNKDKTFTFTCLEQIFNIWIFAYRTQKPELIFRAE